MCLGRRFVSIAAFIATTFRHPANCRSESQKWPDIETFPNHPMTFSPTHDNNASTNRS
jgi:hypothetical protein